MTAVMPLWSLLQDFTVQTVLLGAVLLGIVSGILGAFAVLRGQSLMGDVLSHAALPGICLGFLVAGSRHLGSLLTGAFLTGALAAVTVLWLRRTTRLKMDAALGIVLGLFFAAGVVLLTFIQTSRGAGQAGLNSFLFGQAAAMLRSDLWIMGGVTLGAMLILLAFWKEFKLVTFDPGFATTAGLPVLALDLALTVMIALAIVVGLQMVGVVLMTAMIIAPAAAARQWVNRLESMVILSAVFGVSAGVAGAGISAAGRGLSTGPLIVLAASAIVLVSVLLAPGRGLVWVALRDWRAARRLRARQVLLTLDRLARAHAREDFRSDEGLVDAYHGRRTRRALRALAERGDIRAVRHGPEDQTHWELTDAGRARAAALHLEEEDAAMPRRDVSQDGNRGPDAGTGRQPVRTPRGGAGC
ncbi:metal ABC transporter permease [Plastorhodobacter daqingensis]|uniref:Metal ABC transporter permease n=1 Tax=Plastorhodobacter daqingensis TaxID=1387281 RepID=A0ABW2UFM3_9RHOB